ncbi:hypothetical protein U7537_13925 [Lacticaseibacillus rhamnosus]
MYKFRTCKQMQKLKHWPELAKEHDPRLPL